MATDDTSADREFRERLIEAWREAVRQSVWAVPSVTDEPALTLHQWRLVEIHGARHVMGYHRAGSEGRVSSTVVAMDPLTRQVVTRSGRVYTLAGPPGQHTDAEYVFDRWLRAQGWTAEDVRDVSTAITDAERAPEG